jgi:hypothetical protein
VKTSKVKMAQVAAGENKQGKNVTGSGFEV